MVPISALAHELVPS